MATQDYVLNGTTTFTFPFAVRSASLLTLELVPGGVVSTGDYTVTGAGPTSTGVTVTYPNAPTSATTVLRITRYVQPDRVTTLNGPSDITVSNLNAEFDNAYDAIADFQVAGVNIAQAVIDAEAAEAAAQAAQAAAEAAAAGVDLPSVTLADAGKQLKVNSGGTAYELQSQAVAATASTVVLRDADGRTQFADPAADADAATKGYVDERQAAWVAVVTSPTALTMANVPAAYQGAGLYAIGNSASGIVCTVNLRDTTTTVVGGGTVFGATTNDIDVRQLSYDGGTGAFSYEVRRYLSFVYDSTIALANPILYKLVNANP